MIHALLIYSAGCVVVSDSTKVDPNRSWKKILL
jgi:hypothetical protein